jgi:hypothetical protein
VGGQVLAITVSSASLTDVGTYVLTVYTSLTYSAFTYADTYVINVVITSCCDIAANWNANSIATMTSTVLASNLVRTFTASTFVCSLNCGTVSYTLSPTYSFITLNASTRTITVAYSALTAANIGSYFMTVTASLATYPATT